MGNVDDHGLEVLKKAARNLDPTSKRDYALQVILSALDLPHLPVSPINQDIFGTPVVSELHNQVEVPLDDLNWADYVDQTTTSGGNLSQSNGQIQLSTGANVNGRAAIISKDQVKYRPNQEVGFGFTWLIPQASVANSEIRIGCTDDVNTWGNGVFISHKNGQLNLVYKNAGATIFSLPQSAWDDKCDGSAGSKYVNKAGAPVAADFTKDQIMRIRCGLFGHAGFAVELKAPKPREWVTIYTHTNINEQNIPVFSNFDLKLAAEVIKTGADATVLTLKSACWAGWTGSDKIRLNQTISDRTLVKPSRSVIEGKSSAGGGTYVPVKVTPSGALTIAIGDITAIVGQQTMANSVPVVLASNQSTIPTSTVNGALEATQLAIGILIDAINTKFNTNLSTRATETTLAALLTAFNQLARDAGLNTADTLRVAANTMGFDGTTLRQLLTDNVGRMQTQLVGNDGLYKAFVDSLGRVSTNANVTFPEATYFKMPLQNAGSKAANVNGSVTPVSFRFTPTTNVVYLEELSMVIEDQGDFRPSTFAALAALTTGLQINVKTKGQVFQLGNIKDNADLFSVFPDNGISSSVTVTLQPNITAYALMWEPQNRTVLDPAQGDYIEMLVRDNLTGLTHLNCFATIWRILG